MEAREYFEKEYGHKHIETIVEMQDWVSLYGLMDEFAEWKVKNCTIPDVVGQSEQLLALARYMCEHQNNLDGKTAKDYVQDFLSQ